MTPPFDDQGFLAALVASGHLSGPDAQKARSGSGSLFRRLLSQGLIEEGPLAERAADWLNLPLAPMPLFVEPGCDDLLTSAFKTEHKVTPLSVEGNQLRLALSDPSDSYALEAVKLATGLQIVPVITTGAAVDAALTGDMPPVTAPSDLPTSAGISKQAMSDEGHDGPAAQLLEELIGIGISKRASDIHLEPFEGVVRLRLRVDGRLEEIENALISPSNYNALIGRIKVLSRMNFAEKRKPQDGRFIGVTRGRRVDVRVSILPTLFGESIVLRLLDKTTAPLDLVQLGFTADTLTALAKLFNRERGLILVTGPTGSGKTTTLYAALAGLNTGTRKIVTIEDPVEYDLAGVNQIQVQPEVGLGFVSALRSILRHDPDIIMVGEIRDAETAALAVQAALTGHLVIATVHADSASGVIPRILEMGVEPFLLASTLVGVVNQRLVRRLCKACRQEVEYSVSAIQTIGQNQPTSLSHNTKYFSSNGCSQCNGLGHRGRLPIAEILPANDALAELIRNRAATGLIETTIRSVGLRSLLDDGLTLAAAGETGLEDVYLAADVRPDAPPNTPKTSDTS